MRKCVRCGVDMSSKPYHFYIQETAGIYSDEDEGPLCEVCFPIRSREKEVS